MNREEAVRWLKGRMTGPTTGAQAQMLADRLADDLVALTARGSRGKAVTVQVHMHLQPALHGRISEAAKEEGKTLNGFLNDVLKRNFPAY